jgi:hypothetical protein
MALFDVFRRRRPLRDVAALAAFIDEQAAGLAESTILSYSRMRAGPDPEAVLADAAFRAGVEQARWQAYPLALAMVGEIVAALLDASAENAEAMRTRIVVLILAVFDGRPVPRPIGDAGWQAARQELAASLDEVAQRAGRSADAMVEEFSGFFLALMPIHHKLGGDDYLALRISLRRSLDEARDKFLQNADRPALAAALAAGDKL